MLTSVALCARFGQHTTRGNLHKITWCLINDTETVLKCKLAHVTTKKASSPDIETKTTNQPARPETVVGFPFLYTYQQD